MSKLMSGKFRVYQVLNSSSRCNLNMQVSKVYITIEKIMA